MSKSNPMKRMWINQPSTLQPDHKLHGTNVLAENCTDEYLYIYLLSGDVVSQKIARFSLSNGWINRNKSPNQGLVSDSHTI